MHSQQRPIVIAKPRLRVCPVLGLLQVCFVLAVACTTVHAEEELLKEEDGFGKPVSRRGGRYPVRPQAGSGHCRQHGVCGGQGRQQGSALQDGIRLVMRFRMAGYARSARNARYFRGWPDVWS